MYCVLNVTSDLYWVGGNDRRLALFEGIYQVPQGVSYNSYLLTDEKTVLMDTVDRAVADVFLENVEHVLDGRKLDYVVVQHMEPDHSATLVELLRRYPEATVICNAKTETMMKRFFNAAFTVQLVNEGEVLETGRHRLTFLMAPMVHWPEVMATYDLTDKILFSADAFGCFGALNGALFADEVNFERDYLDEARRYYCNIVGKYGTQVQALLRKASTVEIGMICPLHGFVWRRQAQDFIGKYYAWSSYTPEETGVVIAYGSIYGHTENAAEILSCRLREKGVRTVMYDVSVTPSSEIVAAAFRFSHLVFASATYNAGIFLRMDELLHDLVAHNLQNRTVALIENGSWAPTSGLLMKKLLAPCKNLTLLEEGLSIASALKEDQLSQLDALADAIADSLPAPMASSAPANPLIDSAAMNKLSYGLFVLTSREGNKDNGCIINTAQMLTDNPKRVTIAVNRQNLSRDMIARTGLFNLSVLTEEVPFKVFEHFGFVSGRDADKFADCESDTRTANGLRYVPKYTNAVISCRVVESHDYDTHTLFVAEVVEAKTLSEQPSITYAYYFAHTKPRLQPTDTPKKGFVCKICGYVYEGDTLPEDYVCPLCKHGPEDFEPIG